MAERLSKLRVAFIGVGDLFAAASLRAVAWHCNLVGIVESVSWSFADRDRARASYHSGMRGFANRRRIPWTFIALRGPRLEEFLQRIRPDVICVAGMMQLLRASEWSIAPLGAVNLHPTLLPAYRGPKPTFWQFHDMDLAGGATIHKIDAGIDTGDILTQSRFAIPLGCRPREFFHRSNAVGVDAMIRALSQLQNGTEKPRAQRDLACPRYAREITSGEQFIDYSTWPIERVWHFLRGTNYETKCLTLPTGASGRWRIGPWYRHGAALEPGSLYHDARGHHLSLRDGVIDLQWIPRTLPRRVVEGSLRRADQFARWL